MGFFQGHQGYNDIGRTLLPKSFTGAFFSDGRLDVREVQPKSIRALSSYFGIKFLCFEIR